MDLECDTYKQLQVKEIVSALIPRIQDGVCLNLLTQGNSGILQRSLHSNKCITNSNHLLHNDKWQLFSVLGSFVNPCKEHVHGQELLIILLTID